MKNEDTAASGGICAGKVIEVAALKKGMNIEFRGECFSLIGLG